MKIRKQNNLPPYSRLISLIISSEIKENSYRGTLEIKKKIEELNDIQILGPVDSPIFKKKKKFRTRLLYAQIVKICVKKIWLKFWKKLKISRKIKLTVDVDPINFT